MHKTSQKEGPEADWKFHVKIHAPKKIRCEHLMGRLVQLEYMLKCSGHSSYVRSLVLRTLSSCWWRSPLRGHPTPNTDKVKFQFPRFMKKNSMPANGNDVYTRKNNSCNWFKIEGLLCSFFTVLNHYEQEQPPLLKRRARSRLKVPCKNSCTKK